MVAQIFVAMGGLWLMAAPAVLGYGDPAQTNDQIIGPVVVTFAVVSWWEATRNARWANAPLGIWLILAPFILAYEGPTSVVNSVVSGAAITLLSLVRGRVEKTYGGGWRSLFQPDPPHDREGSAGS